MIHNKNKAKGKKNKSSFQRICCAAINGNLTETVMILTLCISSWVLDAKTIVATIFVCTALVITFSLQSDGISQTLKTNREENLVKNFKKKSGNYYEAQERPTSVDQSMRLCEQNPYANALNMSLADIGEKMDNWIGNKISIEKDLLAVTRDHAHTHKRFDAFEVMGGCKDLEVIGGRAGSDTSKITCGGVSTLEAPCVVYSIGGNNQWQFEVDVLKRTPCEVHTFDCTGEIERFTPPTEWTGRLHFHHICLGTENKKTETGEFWTLDHMTKTLGHSKIDLFKIDIEGYEIPLLQNWPSRSDKSYESTVLPMQVMVEIHYQTHMKELSSQRKKDWKFATDFINLQEHLLKMGYATIFRDNNRQCPHCTELTLLRIRCPEELVATTN